MEELAFLLFLFFALLLGVAMVMSRHRSARLSIFEPGIFFAGTVFVYSAIPLCRFLFYDFTFDSSSDPRLIVLNPTYEDIALIGLFHFLFLCAFLLAYLALRIRSNGIGRIPFKVTDTGLLILGSLYVGSKAAYWLGKWYFDIPATESYIGSYLQLSQLPLLAQQIMGHLQGIAQIYSLVLCLALMSRARYRVWVSIWLGIEALLMLNDQGSRTSFFLLLLTSLIGYHYFVRRLAALPALLLLVVSLFGFIVAGAYRDSASHTGEDWFNGLLIRNEFISVFVNALDIYRLKQNGATDALFPMQYAADLVNVVPQQLLPYEKLDISRWYVETFYPRFAASGGGLVFGVIAESLAGEGLVELLLRGALLGFAFAYFHARAARLRGGLWTFAFYVWLIVLTYRIFRTTTLYLVPLFVLDFLPAWIVAKVSESAASGLRGTGGRYAWTSNEPDRS